MSRRSVKLTGQVKIAVKLIADIRRTMKAATDIRRSAVNLRSNPGYPWAAQYSNGGGIHIAYFKINKTIFYKYITINKSMILKIVTT